MPPITIPPTIRSVICADINKLLVIKHNCLISAKFPVGETLTAFDYKVFLALISQVDPDDIDADGYEISFSELSYILNVRRDYLITTLEKSAPRLEHCSIILDYPANGWTAASPFSTVSVNTDKQTVLFEPESWMCSLVTRLSKNFTSYKLHEILELRSFSSIRMYELLRQFLPIKGKDTGFRTVTLTDLREHLGIAGKYPKYPGLRRMVLEKCQRELQEKTDIQFDFEPIKQGNNTVGVKFTIGRNESEERVRKREEKESRLITKPKPKSKQEPKSESESAIVVTDMKHGFPLSKETLQLLKISDEGLTEMVMSLIQGVANKDEALALIKPYHRLAVIEGLVWLKRSAKRRGTTRVEKSKLIGIIEELLFKEES